MKNKIQKIITGIMLGMLLYAPSTQAASLSLAPSSGTLKGGCRSMVNIYIDTQGANSNAVDAFMSYNPDEISILDSVSGVPGTQLGIGRVYKSYPGNIVGNGSIKLTAFNDTGFFNGRGVLASIAFRSKPGVKSTTINFKFAPGVSTDSNVANPAAQDILKSVSGATFNFVEGQPCEEPRPAAPVKAEPEPEEIPVEEPVEEPEELCPCDEVRPAAPETGIDRVIWIFLVLFLISAFFNVYLMLKDKYLATIKFSKHKISKKRKK